VAEWPGFGWAYGPGLGNTTALPPGLLGNPYDGSRGVDPIPLAPAAPWQPGDFPHDSVPVGPTQPTPLPGEPAGDDTVDEGDTDTDPPGGYVPPGPPTTPAAPGPPVQPDYPGPPVIFEPGPPGSGSFPNDLYDYPLEAIAGIFGETLPRPQVPRRPRRTPKRPQRRPARPRTPLDPRPSPPPRPIDVPVPALPGIGAVLGGIIAVIWEGWPNALGSGELPPDMPRTPPPTRPPDVPKLPQPSQDVVLQPIGWPSTVTPRAPVPKVPEIPAPRPPELPAPEPGPDVSPMPRPAPQPQPAPQRNFPSPFAWPSVIPSPRPRRAPRLQPFADPLPKPDLSPKRFLDPNPNPWETPSSPPLPNPLTPLNPDPLFSPQPQPMADLDEDECNCDDGKKGKKRRPSDVIATVRSSRRRMSENSLENLRKGNR